MVTKTLQVANQIIMSFYRQPTNTQDRAGYASHPEESPTSQYSVSGGTFSGDSSEDMHSPLSPVAGPYGVGFFDQVDRQYQPLHSSTQHTQYTPHHSQLQCSAKYSLFPIDTHATASMDTTNRWSAQSGAAGAQFAQFSAGLPPASNYGHDASGHEGFADHGIGMFLPQSSRRVQNVYDHRVDMMRSTSQLPYSPMQRSANATWEDGGNTIVRGNAPTTSLATSPAASAVSRDAGISRDRNRCLTHSDVDGIAADTPFFPDGSRRCRICGEIVKRKLRRHLETHLLPDLRGHVCSRCDKSFSRQDALARHQYSSATCGDGHWQ